MATALPDKLTHLKAMPGGRPNLTGNEALEAWCNVIANVYC